MHFNRFVIYVCCVCQVSFIHVCMYTEHKYLSAKNCVIVSHFSTKTPETINFKHKRIILAHPRWMVDPIAFRTCNRQQQVVWVYGKGNIVTLWLGTKWEQYREIKVPLSPTRAFLQWPKPSHKPYFMKVPSLYSSFSRLELWGSAL